MSGIRVSGFLFCEKSSGYYADNGYQTVVHTPTKREKLQLRDDLLEFFDLPERPLPRNDVPLLNNSASEFLIDVYKNALGKKNNSENNKVFDFNLSGRDLRAINDSDVIMSFASHYRNFFDANHKRGKTIWFDVTKVSSGEQLVNAELRIYRSLKIKQQKIPKTFVISVYRIFKTLYGKKELKFVSSVNKTIKDQGWMTLNVTEAVQHWVNNPEDNKGLYLSVHPIGRPEFEIVPKDVGIVGHFGSLKKQPFLVGFFKNSELINREKRQKRNIIKKIRKRKSESSLFDFANKQFGVQRGDPSEIYIPKTCRRMSFYVNFRDLGVHDVVIAPDGFEAYYCAGECNFPLSSHMNATNHAVVQTLVNLLQPNERHPTPKACCAPTELIATRVLISQGNRILYKKLKNMVATRCACQ
ncbi:protein 60A-like [Aphidius gifuensis]|uniref:protein 60A-like n=1 Tax=Aphidius gifuensis TaxID=684658 RepID=UPI001CDBFB20|nr:protein 60A-like [Aphidius gifuensis]